MWTAVLVGSVVLGVVVLLLAIAVVGKLILHSLKGPLEARIAERYGPEEIVLKDLGANSFGVESKGVWQGRGNGALVLTDQYLHFFRFVRGADTRIPLAAITELSFTRSHLGKATIYDLLKVRFVEDGRDDSIAWYLADPRAWKERIEDRMAGRPATGGPHEPAPPAGDRS